LHAVDDLRVVHLSSIPSSSHSNSMKNLTEFDLNKINEALLLAQQTQSCPQAIQIFDEILKEHPNQPDALHGKALALFQQKNFQDALGYFEQAIFQAPHVAEFHNNYANALKFCGQINPALQHYHEALRLKQNYPQAQNNLGALHYKLGHYREAMQYFEKSIRMNPDSAETHFNLANCYVQLNRLLDAVAHFKEVCKLQPTHLGALHNLGIGLCNLKNFDEAKPYLEQTVAKEPENVDAWFHLGIIYSALAQAQNAKNAYEKVIELKPSHGEAYHNLATIYLHLNNKEKALSHFKSALKYMPNNDTAQHMILALEGKSSEQGAPLEYTRALFDQYAYNYDAHVKNELKYQVPFLLRQMVTPYLSQSIHAPWKILDLGCGTGLCAPYFADLAADLIGVDVSPNMLEVAKKSNAYFKLVVDDAVHYLKQKNDEYELILCADVLVYFGSLEEIFHYVHRALKTNGLFCFSVEALTEQEISSVENPRYVLRTTGRYAHHPHYIDSLSQHFTIETQQNEVIRYQDGQALQGILYVLRKK